MTWPSNVKIEDSGYVTVIDLEKVEEVNKVKASVPKPIVEETKNDPESLKFKNFFEEIVPFKGQAKHSYSV